MGESFAGISVPEGDPGGLRSSAQRMGAAGTALHDAGRELEGMPSALGSWQGPASGSYAASCLSLSDALGRMADGRIQAAAATNRFADDLEEAREDARVAIEDAREARQEIRETRGRLAAATQRFESAVERASAARTQLSAGGGPGGLPQPGVQEALGQAEADADQSEREIRVWRDRLERAEEDLERAQRRGENAQTRAEEAARRARSVIASIDAGAPRWVPPAAPALKPLPALEEDDGNLLDGLGKAWGDVTGEVSGLAVGGFNHVNFFSGDTFKETWSNDWGIAKDVVGSPLGAAEAMFDGTVAPLVDSYQSGGLDEALGRSPSVLAGVLGGKGLNKLDDLGRSGDGDSGGEDPREDGNGSGDGVAAAPPTRNGHLAGGVHPETGVPFKEDGFPDFSTYSKESVKVEGLTGNQKRDVILANREAGFTKTPPDHVWHHVEDGKTMQLVPREVHEKTGHSGGAALLRRGEVPSDP